METENSQTEARAARERAKYAHLFTPLTQVVMQYRGNPRRQWSELMYRVRLPSPPAFYRLTGHRAITDLTVRQINMRLQNLTDMGQKHVRALAKYWLSQGVPPSDVEKRVAVLRLWASWLRKPVPSLGELLAAEVNRA